MDEELFSDEASDEVEFETTDEVDLEASDEVELDASEEVAPPAEQEVEEKAPKEPKQSPWNLYTVLLAIAVAALVTAIFLMVLELSQYQFNFSANLVG